MPSLTTKYDKIGDERKKVFVLRGDEAYARTVDVSLAYTLKNTNDNIQGFLVRFDATLYRNLGDSILLLYDGDSLLAQVDTHDYLQNYTFDNIRLGWGEEHKIYVKYKANKQTLGKKTKSITINRNIPSQYVPTINITGNTQVTETNNYTVNGTATFMNDTVANGTELNIYLDGEFINTVTTESGAFSCQVGALTTGRHTITAETIQSVSMNAKSQSKALSVGYDIQFLQYPPKLIDSASNTFRISVKNWFGANINSGNVKFNNVNYAISQGIAQFTLSSLATGDYYASISFSKSKTIHIVSMIPTITMTTTEKYIADGYVLPITAFVENGQGLTAKVYDGNTYIADVKVDSRNNITYRYTGSGAGEKTIKFVIGNTEATYTFLDISMNRGQGKTYNLLNKGFNGGEYEETANGCKLILPTTGSKVTFAPSVHVVGRTDINMIEFKVRRFQPSTLQDIDGNIELSFNNSSTVLNLPSSALKSGKVIKVRIHDDMMTQYIQRTSDVVEINTPLDESVSRVTSWTFTNDMIQENTFIELDLEYLIFYNR